MTLNKLSDIHIKCGKLYRFCNNNDRNSMAQYMLVSDNGNRDDHHWIGKDEILMLTNIIPHSPITPQTYRFYFLKGVKEYYFAKFDASIGYNDRYFTEFDFNVLFTEIE